MQKNLSLITKIQEERSGRRNCFRLFGVLLFAMIMGTSSVVWGAVPDAVPWSNYMSIPGTDEINAFHGTRRAPYLCSEPVFNGMNTYDEFSVDFRADYLPSGTYLCVNNWDFDNSSLLQRYSSIRRDYNGVAGYAGFQKDQDGTSIVILTVWDTYCYDSSGNMTVIQAKQIYPANNEGFTVHADDLVKGEGCFVHSLLPYDWQEGKNYRALLQLSNPPDGSNTHLIFYVCDLQTGLWTLLAEYDLGYRGARMNRCVTFLEDFSANGAGNVRSMALSNYRVRPTGQTDWIGTDRTTFYCDYSNDGSYQYGSFGNAFWAVSTGLGNRCGIPADRQVFTVTDYETGSPY